MSLELITELEFQQCLVNNFNGAMEDLKLYNTIFQTYLEDKKKYDLTFYIQDGMAGYHRNEKSKLGFHL